MTSERLRIVSASSVSLEEYALACTAGFSGYLIPFEFDVPQLSRKMRVEQIDMEHSLIAYAGDKHAGIAMLAVRGERGWCGGLGVAPEQRRRGVGRLLTKATLERARAAGLRAVSLEVLAQNTPARLLYESAGMRVVRDLLLLDRAAGPAAGEGVALEEAEASELLAHFARLHKAAPAWQRDLPTILAVGSSGGLRLGPSRSPRAYALLSERADGNTYLTDLGAEDAASARELTSGLVARIDGPLKIVNEPEESLFAAPLLAHGFAETHRQHEMLIEL